MRHVLNRAAIAEARHAKTFCEAIYCGTAPGLITENGLRFYNDFRSRMDMIISPPKEPLPDGVTAAEVHAFDAIAARAKFSARTAATTAR